MKNLLGKCQTEIFLHIEAMTKLQHNFSQEIHNLISQNIINEPLTTTLYWERTSNHSCNTQTLGLSLKNQMVEAQKNKSLKVNPKFFEIYDKFCRNSPHQEFQDKRYLLLLLGELSRLKINFGYVSLSHVISAVLKTPHESKRRLSEMDKLYSNELERRNETLDMNTLIGAYSVRLMELYKEILSISWGNQEEENGDDRVISHLKLISQHTAVFLHNLETFDFFNKELKAYLDQGIIQELIRFNTSILPLTCVATA